MGQGEALKCFTNKSGINIANHATYMQQWILHRENIMFPYTLHACSYTPPQIPLIKMSDYNNYYVEVTK